MCDMAEIRIKVPHVREVKRNGYSDVYFKVHPKDRPAGWRPSIHLGRTDKDSMSGIAKKAEQTYEEYKAFNLPAVERAGTFPVIIREYKQSPFWDDLADSTQRDYQSYFHIIHDWSERNKHPHISTLERAHAGALLSKYDDTPVKQKRLKTVLSLLCGFSFDRGHCNHNVIKGIKLRKRKTEKRSLKLWTEEIMDAFVEECANDGIASLGLIALTMLETSQRKGDVINMQKGRDYKDGKLAYVQSKTGKTVWMNATDKLKTAYKKCGTGDFMMFIHERTGKPWNKYTVTHEAKRILTKIGYPEHILQQTRHSQINYLYEIGLDDQTIIAMTGHENPQTMRQFYREKTNEKLANKGVEQINNHRKVTQRGNT